MSRSSAAAARRDRSRGGFRSPPVACAVIASQPLPSDGLWSRSAALAKLRGQEYCTVVTEQSVCQQTYAGSGSAPQGCAERLSAARVPAYAGKPSAWPRQTISEGGFMSTPVTMQDLELEHA